ncbi:coiled-coil domain-containing protein 186-like isoform X2 [Glandiceps talaboti]
MADGEECAIERTNCTETTAGINGEQANENNSKESNCQCQDSTSIDQDIVDSDARVNGQHSEGDSDSSRNHSEECSDSAIESDTNSSDVKEGDTGITEENVEQPSTRNPSDNECQDKENNDVMEQCGTPSDVIVPEITVTQDENTSTTNIDDQSDMSSISEHSSEEISNRIMNSVETHDEQVVEKTQDVDEKIREEETLQQNSASSSTPSRSDDVHSEDSTIPSNTSGANDSDTSNDEDKLLSELSEELDVVGGSELPNGLKRDIIISELPEYKDLLSKYETIQKQSEQQKNELQSLHQIHEEKANELKLSHQATTALRSEIQRIQAKESSTIDTYQVTVKQLETMVDVQKREIAQFKEKQLSHDAAAKRAIATLKKEMATRVDQVKKMYEEAVKEKESMVIKFAKSEKEMIDQQKINQTLERKLNEQNKQIEVTSSQLKTLKADRSKMKSHAEIKDADIGNLQKEVEKLKEEINSQGIKVKWAQNKLKTELDSHKETRLKLQKTETKLAEAKEETEQIRKNCQEMIKTYQESEEIKSNSLDIKLKERETELEFEKQQKSDQTQMFEQVSKELASLKEALKGKVIESNSLKEKVKKLEEEKQQYEKVQSEFKEMLNNQKVNNKKLTKKVDDLQRLEDELKKEKEETSRLQQELQTLQVNNTELENDIASQNRKQSELLQFTEKITAKNAGLNSENTSYANKVENLTKETNQLTEMCNELKKTNSTLSAELEEERDMRHQENELLTKKLEEKTKALEVLTVQLDDKMDEVKTLKRKHAANIKDLSRQLQQATKKLENDVGGENNTKESLSAGSRTSSSGSLDTAGGATVTSAPATTTTTTATTTASSIAAPPTVVTRTPSHENQGAGESSDFPAINKAMLVERIGKLQKINHKKREKIDFLEDHVNQLLDEIQKKAKIIQQFVLREQTGALAPAAMDANKVQLAKAKIARQGGIMASLYKTHPVDPGMTLDLSLQINKKLQAVLEDTLLKNITLKDNIDTLGDEIARLTTQSVTETQPRKS